MNRSIVVALITSLTFFSGCGAKDASPVPAIAPVTVSQNVSSIAAEAPAVDKNGNDWPVFRRDDQRTGNNPYQTAITTANVSTLAPKWTKTTPGIFASPVVVNGIVYQGDLSGNFYAWKIADGTQLWNFKATGSFVGSPYYYHNALYVGAKGNTPKSVPARLYSINATTGIANWSYAIPAQAELSGSPMVTGGLVYEGTDAKNENLNECDANKQLIALKLGAPVLVSSLNLSPPGLTGADLFSSPALDASGNLFVATGNECTANIVQFPYADAILRVKRTKPTMGVQWAFQSLLGPGNDLDFGATPTFVNGMIVETGKDGYTYALNAATGALLWHTQTGAAIGSSATDGTRVYIPVLQLQPPCNPGAACGAFLALNLSDGSVAWSNPVIQGNFTFSDLTAPAVTNGMVFASYNGAIWALRATNGSALWSFPTPGNVVFAGITVVNGGVLAGDYSGGTFYDFTPGGK
ncbi:MAG: PQQ-binding-like beta-propeller repeat protein [Candidatus Baltobacteraceae bacterium]